MSIRVVQLGSPRGAGEGLRVGTVRRPPRGVPKAEIARRDYYDVWLPNLAPSAELMQEGKAADDPKAWQTFVRRYRAEMARPEASHLLELLAALSHRTSFAVGCYCEDEDHCHRSVLRELLAERGAALSVGRARSVAKARNRTKGGAMNAKPYLMLSGVVFALVAVLHAWRAVAALPVVVGSTALPVWGSWVAVVVAGGLAVWGFRLAGRS